MEALKLTSPTSWQEMSQKQLLYVLRLMAAEIPQEQMQTYCLMRWNGLKVGEPIIAPAKGTVVLVRKKEPYCVDKDVLAAAVAQLEWLASPPSWPVRPDKFGKRKAIDSAFHGVEFGIYLQAENFFQAFLTENDPKILMRLFDILYPGKKKLSADDMKVVPPLILVWMSGIKQLFAQTFGHLFRPAHTNTQESPDMAEIMNAEIRALTGGDITRTQQVLESDTWLALHELDAKAREAEEMEAMRKK